MMGNPQVRGEREEDQLTVCRRGEIAKMVAGTGGGSLSFSF